MQVVVGASELSCRQTGKPSQQRCQFMCMCADHTDRTYVCADAGGTGEIGTGLPSEPQSKPDV